MSTVQDVNYPSNSLFAITKSDSTVFTTAVRQIYVGSSGDLKVRDISGNTVLFKNVIAGSVIGPFFVDKVFSTDTTAADLVGFI